VGKKFPRKPVRGGFAPSTPFDPMASRHEDLDPQGIYPYCAMLQIAEEDKYTDYVMCRGFDTRMQKFVDYAAGDSTKPGIAVAKPWGNRVKCYYHKWSVYPCLLPTQQGSDKVADNFTPPSPSGVNFDWRVGQNPGRPVSSCLGQTQDIIDVINPMIDHNNKWVNWQLIDSGPVFIWAYLLTDLATCGVATASIAEVDAAGEWCDACDYTTLVVSDSYGTVPNSALAAGISPLQFIPAGYNVLVQRVMFPGATMPPRTCQWAAVTFGAPDCCVERELSASVGSGSSSSGPVEPCVFGDCSWIWIDPDDPQTGLPVPGAGYWELNTDTCSILENCACSQVSPPMDPGTEHGQTQTFACVSTL